MKSERDGYFSWRRRVEKSGEEGEDLSVYFDLDTNKTENCRITWILK